MLAHPFTDPLSNWLLDPVKLVLAFSFFESMAQRPDHANVRSLTPDARIKFENAPWLLPSPVPIAFSHPSRLIPPPLSELNRYYSHHSTMANLEEITVTR